MEPDVTPKQATPAAGQPASRPSARTIARRSVAIVGGIAVVIGGLALIPGVRGWASATYGTLTCGDGLERLPDAEAKALRLLGPAGASPLDLAVVDEAGGGELGSPVASVSTDVMAADSVGDVVLAGTGLDLRRGLIAVYPGADIDAVWAFTRASFAGGTDDWLALTRDTGRGIEVIRVDPTTGAELGCLALAQPDYAAHDEFSQLLPDGRIVVGWLREEERDGDAVHTTEVRIIKDDAVDVAITWDEEITHLDVSGDLLLASDTWIQRGDPDTAPPGNPVRAYSLTDGSLAWERPLDPTRREIVLASGLGPGGTDTLIGFTENRQQQPGDPELRVFEVALVDGEGEETWRLPVGEGAAPATAEGGWSTGGIRRWRVVDDVLLVLQDGPVHDTTTINAFSLADGSLRWTRDVSKEDRLDHGLWMWRLSESDSSPSTSTYRAFIHDPFALAGTTAVLGNWEDLSTIDIADGTITSLPIPPGAQISAVSGTERYTFLLYLRTFGEPEPIGVVLKRD